MRKVWLQYCFRRRLTGERAVPYLEPQVRPQLQGPEPTWCMGKFRLERLLRLILRLPVVA